jgi:hypothetical protein
MVSGPFRNYSGDDLLSHVVANAVPSALEGLTSVFGMGTGVTPPLQSPENRLQPGKRTGQGKFYGQASRPISTGKLHASPRFHTQPITWWSSRGLQPPEGGGISYLEEGFTLICFQRLSRPNLAIQLCRWHDNWCTRGSSIPVLSY